MWTWPVDWTDVPWLRSTLALLFGPTRGNVPAPELPDSLAGVEPTPWIGVPLEPGTVQ